MLASKEGNIHKIHDKRAVLGFRKKTDDSKGLGEMIFSIYLIRIKHNTNRTYKKTYFSSVFWHTFLYNTGKPVFMTL